MRVAAQCMAADYRTLGTALKRTLHHLEPNVSLQRILPILGISRLLEGSESVGILTISAPFSLPQPPPASPHLRGTFSGLASLYVFTHLTFPTVL